MQYTFEISWLIGGLLVVVVGAVMLRFYRPIADNFFLRYSVVQAAAIIICVLGFLAATNLLPFLLGSLVTAMMPRMGM